jgi:hypothetical protein
MNKSLVMNIVYRAENLYHNFSRILFVKFLSFDNFVKKLSTFEDIHYQIEVGLVFVNLIKFYDILMVHLLENIYFTLELLDFLRVIDLFFLDEFNCSF